MMTPEKTDLAVWRYGIISVLLHRTEEAGTLDSDLQHLVSDHFAGLTGELSHFRRRR